MREVPSTASMDSGRVFSQKVRAAEARKLNAKLRGPQDVWFGFGLFGLIGWAIATPTLLGIALGVFLDRRYPGVHSWTLSLLIVGLFLGCLNAWHWIAKEENVIRRSEVKKDE